MPTRKFYSNLYVQVLAAIALGVVVGLVWPDQAAAMKPLGDGFIKLIRMIIGPIVFTTVAAGIARTGTAGHVGRIGLVTLIYFELASTVALGIGLAVSSLVHPGSRIVFDPSTVDLSSIAAYTTPAAQSAGVVEFLLQAIPDTIIGAFARGEVLQILVVALLVGFALLQMGPRAARLVDLLGLAGDALFATVGLIMRLAPIGAFGAMAFTIGRYGLGSLVSLGTLIASVYVACAIFVLLLSGLLAIAGIPPLRFLRYIREEILIVLGTSSSESVLPRIIDKLERLGCERTVVGLVIPTGYSFNLDGTAIYMTMAALFVAQASGVELTITQQLGIVALLMVTSKGAAAVTGSGFVTLAATLAAFPSIPIAGLTLLVGVDRFMSEARAITNLIGNAVATVLVARWDGALDLARARRVLADPGAATALDPAADRPAESSTGGYAAPIADVVQAGRSAGLKPSSADGP